VALGLTSLLSGVRAFDRLLQLEEKLVAALEAQASDIQGLKDRLTKLEEYVRAREDVLVAEAKGAAAAVASVAASQHVSDIARRLGAMEERLRGSAAARLQPPDGAT
jgi:hypothetical protein